jgi:hypothetical protein
MKIAALFSVLLLCTACGEKKADDKAGADESAGVKGAASDEAAKKDPPAAGNLFTEDDRKDPCKLLTPKMVAEVAEVAHEALQQRTLGGMCVYSWKGGQASLGFVRVGKTAEERKERFDREHKSMTGEEVKAAMGKVADTLATRKKEGKTDVAPKTAKTVTKKVGGVFNKGITFEPEEGVGDKAMFETTKTEQNIADTTIISYANKMGVLYRNMSFSVMFSKKDGPQGKQYRDEVVALGKAVVAGLSQ